MSVLYSVGSFIKNKLKPPPDPVEWGFNTFIQQGGAERFGGKREVKLKLYTNEATSETAFDSHYIYHPAWASRILAQIRPEKHIDISSTLYFCTIVSAFIPISFYDYRPAPLSLSHLHCGKADLTALPFESNSIFSLSCMHTVEHIGLGRYGDTIQANGDIKAMAELKRVLAPGGNLLFVVPTGKPTVIFNAHRIYTTQMILKEFEGLELADFSLVDDKGSFHKSADRDFADNQNYGCGCFWFRKPLI